MLVLLRRFRLPLPDIQSTENRLDSIADFRLGTIRDEGIHSSSEPNLILKRIDELPIRIHSMNTHVVAVPANVELNTLNSPPTIDVQEYRVGTDSLVTR